MDALWSEKAALLSPIELSCHSGCFGCCIGLFSITFPEAIAVRQAVAALPRGARVAVLGRARRAVERTRSSFPGDPGAGILDPERTDASEERWFESARLLACPALELPSGRCAVYAARPITCRTFGLARRKGAELAHPPGELNLPGASPARTRATAIDAGRLAALDRELAEAASEAGLPGGAGTTVAHALAGTAFPMLSED